MKTILILTVCCISASVADQGDTQVPKKFEIVKYNKETAEPIKGLVSGAKQCGGPGKFVSLHIEACEQDGADICSIPKGATGRVEMMFVPSEDIKNITVKFTVASEDGKYKKDASHELNDVNVVAGGEYILKFTSESKPGLEGKKYTSQVELLKGLEHTVELCSTADFVLKN